MQAPLSSLETSGDLSLPPRPGALPPLKELQRIGQQFIAEHGMKNAAVKIGYGAHPLPDGGTLWGAYTQVVMVGWPAAGGAAILGAARCLIPAANESEWAPLIERKDSFEYRGRSLPYLAAVAGLALENLFAPKSVIRVEQGTPQHLGWVGFLCVLKEKNR
jgi:hypothetical protein